MKMIHRPEGRRPSGSRPAPLRTRAYAVAGVLACLLAAAGCGGSSGGGGGAKDATATKSPLRIGVTYSAYQYWKDPVTFGISGREVNLELGLAYAPLTHMQPNGTVVPAVATSWHYSTTGTPYEDFTLTLRHDVKFADGTPLNAAAVVGWFNHFWDNHTGASPGYSALLGPNPKFQAVGEWTVEMHLTRATPDLPALLSDGGDIWGFIGSPKCVANPALFATQTCGAGPYQLESAQTVAGDHYTYVPNPYYYDTKNAKFSQVTVKVIPLASSMLQALQAGQLDIAAVGNDASTAAAAKSSGFTVNAATNGAWVSIFNLHVKAMADIRVREAINYAIDRKAIADATGFGYSQPYSEFPVSDAADPAYTSYYPYDPAKAKSLLAAAGYPHGLSLTTHLTGQGQQLFPVVAKYLAAVGINVNVLPLNTADMAASANDPFGFVQMGFSPTLPSYVRWLDPTSPFDLFGNDPTTSSLYSDGLKANDPIPDWKEMWGRTVTQARFLVVGTFPILYYSSKSVGGVNVTLARAGTPLVTEMYPTGK